MPYRYRRRANGGFSLIELMVVVVIIAILTAVAIPQYQVYTQRSRVSSSLGVARPMLLAIAEYAALNAELPSTAEQLLQYGIDAEGRNFRSALLAAVRYGGDPPTITLVYRDTTAVPRDLRGRLLVLLPQLGESGLVSYSIGPNSTVPAQLRPRL